MSKFRFKPDRSSVRSSFARLFAGRWSTFKLLRATVLIVLSGCLWISSATFTLSTEPVAPSIVDVVDLIEVNHVYDLEGKPVLSQLIYYEFVGGRYRVRTWELLKSNHQHPVYNYNLKLWTVIYTDVLSGSDEATREIRSRNKVERWTQYDPEREDRDELPSEQRHSLLFERKFNAGYVGSFESP